MAYVKISNEIIKYTRLIQENNRLRHTIYLQSQNNERLFFLRHQLVSGGGGGGDVELTKR